MPGPDRGPLDAASARFIELYGAALELPQGGADVEPELTAQIGRERAQLLSTPGRALLSPEARAVEVADHVSDSGLALRSYVPEAGGAGLPVVVYLHGGGFVTGSIAMNDTTCRILAAEGHLVVVSVEYRLAPEHPYPQPLDDAESALEWAADNAKRLFDADTSKLVVMGGSAGGALAAASALRDRDRGRSRIALQALIYPVLDASMSTESYRPEVNGTGYFISADHMRWYWAQYRGSQAGLDSNPYFSPAAAPDLTGLPPAIIITAEFDALRDEGAIYHARLHAAGIASQLIHYDTQIHGFMALFDSVDAAYPAVAELGRLVSRALEDAH
ncbi:alpha/beta hydrolase [Herbiconiux ginsengi]|uniref:Acetyl esterase n=1 Tax=Herbiconiux ginsengi TaxID=381665 RepID=A0A1H3TF62_9MICO|nr:alpha/beta hydrolase [Herbiconiux ginsengi]SDZ48912.1 acetyl esterase [Herbiconiux ginsengi]